MSGGHYDYLYFQVSQLANLILCDKELDRKDYLIPEDIKINIKTFARYLSKVADLCKDIEWYMSSDTGDKDIRESFEKFNYNICKNCKETYCKECSTSKNWDMYCGAECEHEYKNKVLKNSKR